MKTRASLKHFLNDCLWKHAFASNFPQTPLNLFSLTVLVTLRPFRHFQPKIRAIKLQKSAQICLSL